MQLDRRSLLSVLTAHSKVETTWLQRHHATLRERVGVQALSKGNRLTRRIALRRIATLVGAGLLSVSLRNSSSTPAGGFGVTTALAAGGIRLPFPAGTTLKVDQGGFSSVGRTHATGGRQQHAVDLSLRDGVTEGTAVVAVTDGTITQVRSDVPADRCGDHTLMNTANYVILKSDSDGSCYIYWHLKSVVANLKDQHVRRGQKLGEAGKTGFTGCYAHLHFQRQWEPDRFGTSIPLYFDEAIGQELREPDFVAGKSRIIVSQNAPPGFGTIVGRVSDPLVGVGSGAEITVTSSWGTRSSNADGAGYFRLDNVPSGPARVIAKRVTWYGYVDVDVEPNGVTDATITSLPLQAPPVGGQPPPSSSPITLEMPSSAQVGASVPIKVRVSDASYSTIRVTFGCGSPDRYEIGSTSADFQVATAGCPGGARTVIAEARRANEGWDRAISTSATINLVVEPPNFDFVADSATEGAGPLTVQFSIRNNGWTNSFVWDFGDGATGTAQPTTAHTYAVPGTYSVTLTGTGPGGSRTVSKPGFVRVSPGAANALVLSLDFDEGSGSSSTDRSGYGNHAQIVSALWAPGVRGTAVQGTGRDGVGVKINGSESLRSNTFTFAATIKVPTTGTMIASQGESNSERERWKVSADGDRLNVEIWSSHGSSGVVSNGGLLTPGQWNSIAFSFDGQNVKFYRNGVLHSSKTLQVGGINSGASTLYIGSFFGGGWATGEIDEVRYWNFVTTPATSQPTPTPTTPLPSSTSTPPATPASSSTVWEGFSGGVGNWTRNGPVSQGTANGDNFLRFQPSNGSAEASRNASGVSLSGYQALELRINLNGATLGGGDQSAWYMNQGTGWKWVVLANHVTQRSTAWQTIRVPLSSFGGFDPSAPFANMGFRFWSASAVTIDIDDIKFVTSAAPTTATPTSVPPTSPPTTVPPSATVIPSTSTPTRMPATSTPPATPASSSTVWEGFSGGVGNWTRNGPVSQGTASGDNFLRFQPSNGSAEASRSASGVSLSGYQALELRINLNGATLGGGDQSAWYMNQGTGWKWVVLANYVTQRSTAWQTIRIPLSSFSGFNPSASFSNMGFRFWSGSAVTIDIDDIKFVR